jgi:hypothetical protein
MVGLVEDEQATRQQRAEPLTHRIGVVRVAQQRLPQKESAVRAPRIDAKAVFSADVREVAAIEDLEDEQA